MRSGWRRAYTTICSGSYSTRPISTCWAASRAIVANTTTTATIPATVTWIEDGVTAQAARRPAWPLSLLLARCVRDDFDKHEVMLAFTHGGRPIQLTASAKGWAQMYLKENPWTSRRFISKADHEQKALRQGHVAVNSILRDWIKGQVTAIECGILSFEAVFMPFMLTSDGRPLFERVNELLPKADAPKVVSLPVPGGQQP